MSVVEQAHDWLVGLLGDCLPGCPAQKDAALPQSGKAELLNVVKAARPAEVTAVCMGIDEDEVEEEFVQTFNIEWIVRSDDAAQREARFQEGLASIGAALRANRTLAGIAHGLVIAPPYYEGHALAGAVATKACFIPVRVALRAVSQLA